MRGTRQQGGLWVNSNGDDGEGVRLHALRLAGDADAGVGGGPGASTRHIAAAEEGKAGASSPFKVRQRKVPATPLCRAVLHRYKQSAP